MVTTEPKKPSEITSKRIRLLVNECLSQKGITINSIDRVANIEGDPENQELRDIPIWYTKQAIDHAVTRQLGLDERKHIGSARTLRQIHAMVTLVINELEKSGELRDWNSRIQTGVWRLEHLSGGDVKYPESGANDFVVIVGKKDEERFRRFAIGEDKIRIENTEALREADRVWALLRKRTPDAIWSRIRSGDHVFFARYGMPFSHVGTVSGTLTDRSLATRLWGDSLLVRQLDKLVLFSSVQEISKQFRKTCKLADINPGSFTAIYVVKKRIYDLVIPDRRPTTKERAGVAMLEDSTDGIVTLGVGATGPPSKATEAVTRFLRDTEKVRQLKSKYLGKCQICEYVLRRPDGCTYSEVHHMCPLKDSGDDDFGNMLNLCAKHHVEFDYLVIGISEDCRTIIDRDRNKVGTITFSAGHKLARKNVLFHLRRMGIK